MNPNITCAWRWLRSQEAILGHGPVNCNLPTCGQHENIFQCETCTAWRAQRFSSSEELLPLISFMLRAFRAFPAPDMFLNRTNANPLIFPSVIRKSQSNKSFLNRGKSDHKTSTLINRSEKMYRYVCTYQVSGEYWPPEFPQIWSKHSSGHPRSTKTDAMSYTAL